MRPLKYPSLGDMSMVRMPTRLHSSLHQLLGELDRLSEHTDPDELLSSIIDNLSDQWHYYTHYIMNTILLSLLLILSDLIELTFDAGQFTRKHILPLVVYVGVAIYHYGLMTWDTMTSQQYTLKVYPTPLTTGYAHAWNHH